MGRQLYSLSAGVLLQARFDQEPTLREKPSQVREQSGAILREDCQGHDRPRESHEDGT